MNESSMPSVTVIIPVCNEERNIAGSLEQVMAQTYPASKLQVLIIDGMSDDNTRSVVERFSSDSLFDIKILDNLSRRIETALNIGVKNSDSDIILRIDARTRISSDYIVKCVNTLLETGADNVGGIQRPIVDESLNDEQQACQFAIGTGMSHPFGVGNAQFRIGKKSGYVDTVYLGCFRKDIFEMVGLFDEDSYSISEDSDMNMRIRAGGGKVYLDNSIVACYYPRETLKSCWDLYSSYGIRKAGNLLKYKKFTAWRQFVPPVFLSSLLLLPVAGLFITPFWYLWLLAIAMYLGAELFFVIRLVNGKDCSSSGYPKRTLFKYLLLVFPTMHFSWAFGFWSRILKRPAPGEHWKGLNSR